MMLSVCVIGTSAESKLPFTDTPEGEWYYDAVKYVYDNGLMNGTGDGTKFSPMMNLTRGMVVTVLYRNDGSHDTSYIGAFADITADKYYALAADWAYKSNIVTGTGTDDWGDPLFSPDRNITRQELATMIGRYAAYRHVDTDKNTADVTTFPDAGKVASWATDTFKWASGTGIITGKGTGSSALLAPEDLATRAEFATIIRRFNDKDAEREFTYKLAYTAPVAKSQYTEKAYPPVDDADVYVAVDGNDKNPGTFEKPLGSFEAAKAKVLEIKKTKKSGEIKVAFKAGNYGMLDNVTFTPNDGGNDELTITYCAYGDGKVVFQNGIYLANDEFKPVDESDYYLLGDVDKSMVYKIDLTGKVTDFSDKNIMFSETGMCHEARIPNYRAGVQEQAYWNVTTTYNETESILLQSYLPGIVSKFRTTEGMKVTGMLRTGWLVDTFKVKSFDPTTGVLSFDFTDPHAFDNGYTLEDFVLAEEGRMDDYVYFHNLSDQIDAKGEYWFDNNTFTLYMYKPEGNHYLSTAGTFITLKEEVEHISFVGLDFIATTDDAIDMDANHISFDRCTFGNVAGSACIYTEWGYRVNNITVENCEFYNFYDKGVTLFGSWPELANITPSHVTITNNYFHDFSSPQTFGAAVNLTNLVGTTVSHNEFLNGAHAGISFGSCIDTVMEYNVLDNMMSSTIDYGAIYNFNTILHRGNIVRHNIIRNIRSAGGCYGVYIDGSFDQEVYGNIFFNAGDRDIVSNGGRENEAYDNISIRTEGAPGDFFMYNLGPVDIDEEGNLSPVESTAGAAKGEIEQKPAVGSASYQKWYDRWPILYEYSYDFNDIDKYECIYRTVNYVNDNALIGSTLEQGVGLLTFGVHSNNVEYSRDVNPFFADPTHGDYTITDTTKFADNHYEMIGRY